MTHANTNAAPVAARTGGLSPSQTMPPVRLTPAPLADLRSGNLVADTLGRDDSKASCRVLVFVFLAAFIVLGLSVKKAISVYPECYSEGC